MLAAIERGYSRQTVKHMRNVLSAIFSFAKETRCFMGENPVSLVRLPEAGGDDAPAETEATPTLTFAKANEALKLMEHPEKEMMLMALLADLNMGEIRGLQWKRVNLGETEMRMDDESVPPATMAIREQWYLDRLEGLKRRRVRNLPIPPPLVPLLMKLRDRARFTGPEDFVFVSRQGTPVNQSNIVKRRLNPLATKLGVPSLSWQVFRRTRKVLEAEFGSEFMDVMAVMVGSLFPTNKKEHSTNIPAKKGIRATVSFKDASTRRSGSSQWPNGRSAVSSSSSLSRPAVAAGVTDGSVSANSMRDMAVLAGGD
jgi:integrase